MARKPGKRVDWLTFDVGGVYYKVELRAETGMHDEKFHLCMDKPEMHIVGTDLAAMKKDAKKFIEANCTAEWEKWVAVDVNDPDRRHSDRNEYRLEISWYRFEQMVSLSGTKMYRTDHNQNSYNGWLTEQVGRHGVTYVRETQDLIATLEEIGERVELLRKRLKTLLSPKKITDTIKSTISRLDRLLPHGDE